MNYDGTHISPRTQIDNWVRKIDQCKFIDAVYGETLKPPIDDDKDTRRVEARIMKAYEKIHKYVDENTNRLTPNDARCIEKLAERIASVGLYMDCNDPKLEDLISLAARLKSLQPTPQTFTFDPAEIARLERDKSYDNVDWGKHYRDELYSKPRDDGKISKPIPVIEPEEDEPNADVDSPRK